MENLRKYWKEEEGLDLYTCDSGFFAYSVDGDEFYVAHCYVGERNKSYKVFEKMKEIARENNCKYMSGNLDLNEYNKEGYRKKIMVHLGNGYKVVNVTDKRITVIYEL